MFQPPSPTRVIGLAALAVAAAALGSAPAKADSSTGTIGVSLNVNASCMVNGAAMASNLGQIGSIAFTDQSDIFGDTSAQLVATGGGNATRCSARPALRLR